MINFVELDISDEEKNAVISVLNSKMIIQGPKVKEFEERFAAYCDTKYAVAVNSGTAALHSALYAMGIKEGDEVITTPFTFVATANSILMQRAKVVFADIKEDTFNINPDSILEKITPKTKAIIPVSLFGQVYDVKAINKIAEDYNLLVLEDACQAIGAQFNGKKSGSFGNLAAFSFYATKNMMCGEGGMITTNNKEYVERIKQFRHHGQSETKRYEYYNLGYNYRMTDVLAAIGLEQLKKIDILTQKRIQNANRLTFGLKSLRDIETPYVTPESKHVYHQYTLKIKNPKERDEVIKLLKDKSIITSIFYPKPLHLTPFYNQMGFKESDFPIAEKISQQVLSLPIHPLLKEEDIDFIIDSLKEILQ